MPIKVFLRMKMVKTSDLIKVLLISTLIRHEIRTAFDVTAAPFSVSFSQLPAAKKPLKTGQL